MLSYFRKINKNSFAFDFLDIYGDGIAFEKEIKELGGNIYTCSNYKNHPILFAKRMFYLLKINNYDIVHYHMQSTANLIPILVSLFYNNVVVICHSHSSACDGFIRNLLDFINKKILYYLPVEKIACSKKAGKWMFGNDFLDSNIIYNAIDYEKFKFNKSIRNEMRKKLNFSETDKILGFVGRFSKEKNTSYLISILKSLKKISNSYKLMTIGDGDDFGIFSKLIEKENLNESCINIGWQIDTAKYYQVFDAFLLPSFFEGFSVVRVEAQASGLPCFFSENITREINLSNNCCFFLPISEENSDLWAKMIDNCLNKYSRNSNEFNNYFKIDVAVKLLEKKYKKIMNKHHEL